jgi:LacI family transcriptional regulator
MLRIRRSDTVAMLIPQVQRGMPTNTFFMDVLSGAKDYFQLVGYNLVVVTFSETGEGAETDLNNLKVLQNHWMDGFLVVPNLKRRDLWGSIAMSKTPFVLLDRLIPGMDCSSVYNNSCNISREAVKLLASCGRRRIAYIGGSVHSITGSDRFTGYDLGMKQAGLERDVSLVKTCDDLTVEEGYRGMEELLKEEVEGVYISNNVLTIGAMECIHHHGVKVPGELGVVAFEDYEWMRITDPPLTTVRQQPYQMGRLGAELLRKIIENPNYKEQIHLESEIVLRQSHGTIQNQ